MKQIWAPWRVSYITNTTGNRGCIFCLGYASEDVRDRLVLLKKESSLIMLNRYPYTGGHLMVAPRRHVADINDLTDEEMLELMQGVQQATLLLQNTIQPEGFNIGLNQGKSAGAGFAEHLHIHIVPRWSGDTNFMSVIDDVRVIPEGLLESYDRLKSILDSKG